MGGPLAGAAYELTVNEAASRQKSAGPLIGGTSELVFSAGDSGISAILGPKCSDSSVSDAPLGLAETPGAASITRDGTSLLRRACSVY